LAAGSPICCAPLGTKWNKFALADFIGTSLRVCELRSSLSGRRGQAKQEEEVEEEEEEKGRFHYANEQALLVLFHRLSARVFLRHRADDLARGPVQQHGQLAADTCWPARSEKRLEKSEKRLARKD